MGLECDKICDEYNEIKVLIDYLCFIFESEEMQCDIIKEELVDIKECYGDDCCLEISFEVGDIFIEDFIKDEEVVVIISYLGYIKWMLMLEFCL